MKTQTIQKLANYSAMAGALLINPAHSKAQIYYTDIDPDIVLDDDPYIYYLDMDLDWINNFYIFRGMFSTETDYGIAEFTNIFIMGIGPNNDVAASMGWTGLCSSCSTTFVTAYALESDIMVNEEYDFFQYGDMAHLEDSYSAGGGWGNWFPDTENKFLGVRFEAPGGVIHYGWIRCSVEDDYIVTIKDFAYEGLSHVPIITGDTGACYSPVPIGTAGITSSSAKPKWEPVPSADYYKLQYRILGTFSWTSKTIDYPKTFRKLTGLDCNTTYEWRITTACTDGSVTGWSPLQNFTTASCRLPNEDAIDQENINIHTYSNQLYINIDEDYFTPLDLIIFDELGRSVFEQQISQEQNIIELHLPSGIYIATVQAINYRYQQIIYIQN